jgi:hypothetical protein
MATKYVYYITLKGGLYNDNPARVQELSFTFTLRNVMENHNQTQWNMDFLNKEKPLTQHIIQIIA